MKITAAAQAAMIADVAEYEHEMPGVRPMVALEHARSSRLVPRVLFAQPQAGYDRLLRVVDGITIYLLIPEDDIAGIELATIDYVRGRYEIAVRPNGE